MNTTTDDNDNCDESDNDKMMKLRVLSIYADLFNILVLATSLF